MLPYTYFIKYHFVSEKDSKKLGGVSEELYTLLQKEKLLGKNCKQRSTILKTVFKFLDVEDPKVLLGLARLILAVSLLTHVLRAWNALITVVLQNCGSIFIFGVSLSS